MFLKNNLFSTLESAMFFAHGSCYASLSIERDMENYNLLKQGKISNNKQICLDTQILYVLDNLGFDMEHIGTYLYKDVIKKVYNILGNIDEIEKYEKYRDLLLELNNRNSNFYFDIAREEKEIGVKSFFRYIDNAIEKSGENNEYFSSKIGLKLNENFGTSVIMISKYIKEKNDLINNQNRENVRKIKLAIN